MGVIKQVNPKRLLIVDLTQRRVHIKDLDQNLIPRFLGGRGLGVWLAHELIGPKCDPLGPENVLILSTGLLAATGAPCSSRLHLNALSPLTGLMGSSNAGGHAATALAAQGFLSVLIKGRAERPVHLIIEKDRVQIAAADHLWGLDAWQTQERLAAELGGSKLRSLTIGPAGENQVPLACVLAGRDHVAGRTGLGAVMGSKNLKAVALRARGAKPKMSPAARSLADDYLRRLKTSPLYETVAADGQAAFVAWCHEMGMLATRNYRDVQFEAAEKISGEQMRPHLTGRSTCPGCPIHCKAEVNLDREASPGLSGPRPEFESLVALGSKCGLDDLKALINLNNLCARLGLDTMSAGSSLAFAMDLFAQGIISDKDAGGLDLRWGNAAAMERLLKQMALNEGLGAILAQGVRRAAGIIGRGAAEHAFHVKGLELAAYDPRGAKGTALGYAVSGRGGDFAHVFDNIEYRWSPQKAAQELGHAAAAERLREEGKAASVRRALIVSAVLDSLGLCKVPALSLMSGFDLKDEAAFTAALAGLKLNPSDLLLVGERIINLERIFNLGHSNGLLKDELPAKFLTQPAPQGPAAGQTVALKPMLEEFYGLMGWDEAGRPREDKLWELGLWPHITWIQSQVAAGGETNQSVLVPIHWPV